MVGRYRQESNLKPLNIKPLERTAAQKTYFYLDDKLYKMLRQDRGGDILSAWDFAENKTVHFILSDAKKKMKNAFDTIEVAQILNRTRSRIQSYVNTGKIASPVRIYSKGKNVYGAPFDKMKWSEDDVLRLHEFLLTAGNGRPRKDGVVYAAPNLPSRKEVIALMRQQPLFYMKTSSGDMLPVWSAYNEV